MGTSALGGESAGNSLRPFIPEIISVGGGGITLDLLNNFKPHYEEVPQIHPYQHVYQPMPLRWYPAIPINGGASSSRPTRRMRVVSRKCSDRRISKSINVDGGEGSSSSSSQIIGKKRKREDGGGGRKKKRAKHDELPRPLVPPSTLVEAIEWRSASRAVFLYRKKLEESDIKANQNRLMVTGREAVVAFLREEEKAAMADKLGLKICGVDERGRIYSLVLKLWVSVNQMVMNYGWNKMVSANNAEAGDVVDLWGFRENDGKLGFGVVFKKSHSGFFS